MSWIVLDDYESLCQWASTINRLTGRFILMTNATPSERTEWTLPPGPLLLLLRPSVGGRVDSAYLSLDLSHDSMVKVLSSPLVQEFYKAGRFLHIRDFVIREDSNEALSIGSD